MPSIRGLPLAALQDGREIEAPEVRHRYREQRGGVSGENDNIDVLFLPIIQNVQR